MIGVFKHTDDNQVKFTTSINRVSDLKGKTFTPGKVRTISMGPHRNIAHAFVV
jgi:hypothetical protein